MKKIMNIIGLILYILLWHYYGHWSFSIEKTYYALTLVIENIPSIYITIINLNVVWLYLISILSKENVEIDIIKYAQGLMWWLSFFLIIETIIMCIHWLSLDDATTVWFITINHPVPIEWKVNYLYGVLVNIYKNLNPESKLTSQEIVEYWADKINIDRIRTLDRKQLTAYAEELIIDEQEFFNLYFILFCFFAKCIIQYGVMPLINRYIFGD